MKSPVLSFVLALLAPISAPLSFAASAPEKATQSPPARASLPPPGEQLVITKGVFAQNGENLPATMRNLVDLVLQRYPDATITLVGVENIVIENLTLTLRRVRVFNDSTTAKPQPVLSVLTAFAQASGRKFFVQAFSENDFLLSAEIAPNRQITEVFNLGTVMKPSRSKPVIEEEIRRLETRLAVLRNRYGEQHSQIVGLRDEIEILRAQIAQGAAAMPSVDKLIEQIQDAVATTLRVSSRNPMPEFKYHPGTNLLIAVGSEPAIDATRKVIAALEKTPQ